MLGYLQRVQGADGAFQARYLPDGSGDVPDGRGEETDGLGWALWAAEQTVLAAPPGPARSTGGVPAHSRDPFAAPDPRPHLGPLGATAAVAGLLGGP